jgi:hypothetical protein
MALDNSAPVIRVTPQVKRRLDRMVLTRAQETGRRPSLCEVIERLIETHDQLAEAEASR